MCFPAAFSVSCQDSKPGKQDSVLCCSSSLGVAALQDAPSPGLALVVGWEAWGEWALQVPHPVTLGLGVWGGWG